MNWNRFRDADSDLCDCISALEERDLPASPEELNASRNLYRNARRYIEAYELEYGNEED